MRKNKINSKIKSSVEPHPPFPVSVIFLSQEDIEK